MIFSTKSLGMGTVVGIAIGFIVGYVLLRTNGSAQRIDELENQIENKNNQINTLQNQVNSFQSQISSLNFQTATLQAQIDALNESYTELLRKYEDLLFHYDLLNKPASSFATVKDLNITFAIDRTTYYYKDPVSGNVTITYLNGTAFRGTFILYIRHLTKEAMSTTAGIAVDGFAKFYLSPPVFRFGPGNYTIGIASLSTIDGYIISAEWQNFPSVRVEAK